jgi:hypothetical protein
MKKGKEEKKERKKTRHLVKNTTIQIFARNERNPYYLKSKDHKAKSWKGYSFSKRFELFSATIWGSNFYKHSKEQTKEKLNRLLFYM